MIKKEIELYTIKELDTSAQNIALDYATDTWADDSTFTKLFETESALNHNQTIQALMNIDEIVGEFNSFYDAVRVQMEFELSTLTEHLPKMLHPYDLFEAQQLFQELISLGVTSINIGSGYGNSNKEFSHRGEIWGKEADMGYAQEKGLFLMGYFWNVKQKIDNGLERAGLIEKKFKTLILNSLEPYILCFLIVPLCKEASKQYKEFTSIENLSKLSEEAGVYYWKTGRPFEDLSEIEED